MGEDCSVIARLYGVNKTAADCLLGEASIRREANVDRAGFGLGFVGILFALGLTGVIGTTGSS